MKGRRSRPAHAGPLGGSGQTRESIGITLSRVVHDFGDIRRFLSDDAYQELAELAQMLDDLGINGTDELMRKLGAVYVVKDTDDFKGSYYWGIQVTEINNRRKAIMKQMLRKESSENEGT